MGLLELSWRAGVSQVALTILLGTRQTDLKVLIEKQTKTDKTILKKKNKGREHPLLDIKTL